MYISDNDIRRPSRLAQVAGLVQMRLNSSAVTNELNSLLCDNQSRTRIGEITFKMSSILRKIILVYFNTHYHKLKVIYFWFRVRLWYLRHVSIWDTSFKRKPPWTGGMELLSLSWNHVLISVKSVETCQIAIATMWEQFHATDECGFLFMLWTPKIVHINSIELGFSALHCTQNSSVSRFTTS